MRRIHPSDAAADPPVKRTRVSAAWVAVIVAAVVLVLLLIFILQNSRNVEVSYFSAHGHLPLGVALLLAAVGGILLVAVPGTARIVQLRRSARRALTTPPPLPSEQPPAPPGGPDDAAGHNAGTPGR